MFWWHAASSSTHYTNPLVLSYGRGTFLFDIRGQAFLDCVNNPASLGHCHPAVVEAASEQVDAALPVSVIVRFAGLRLRVAAGRAQHQHPLRLPSGPISSRPPPAASALRARCARMHIACSRC
eukprot:2865841-Rhodomonas_salina.1